MEDKLIKYIEVGDVQKFYKSGAWNRKRQEILERDNYECQMCKEKGLFKKADVVHHIKHLKARADLGLTESNLLSLCNVCHNDVHPEKLNGYEVYYERQKISAERW